MKIIVLLLFPILSIGQLPKFDTVYCGYDTSFYSNSKIQVMQVSTIRCVTWTHKVHPYDTCYSDDGCSSGGMFFMSDDSVYESNRCGVFRGTVKEWDERKRIRDSINLTIDSVIKIQTWRELIIGCLIPTNEELQKQLNFSSNPDKAILGQKVFTQDEVIELVACASFAGGFDTTDPITIKEAKEDFPNRFNDKKERAVKWLIKILEQSK